MSKKAVAVTILIIFILIGMKGALFTVDEREQAIILQLGKHVRTIQEPGLYFKVPLVQNILRFEDRILEYDASAAKIITADKKHLVVDNYARWKIIDPLKFYETVRNEFGAQARLDDIVFSELREELARHTLTEIVSLRREMLMDKVGEKCDQKAREYGIQIIDVRIKRADLPREVTHSVYARMKAERNRIAKKYRSEGEEEAVKIRAKADRERTILLAESYRKAEILRGAGDARAIKIYARAFGQDPEFYSFLRTLEVYKKSLAEETTIVLSSDSELFRYLSPTRK
jgi:membrane protease subunit HflC